MKYLHRTLSYSLVALGALSASAFAQEQGRVISTTPVIAQVAVPRQVCSNEQVSTTSTNKSGAGALIGGIAGGAMGNAVGQGNGRAAATAIGIFGGAILGNHIEGGQPQASSQNVQRCTTQTFYENRTTAYNVVYEFNGKQYQVQMPQDPGPFVALQVTPVSPAVQPVPVLQPPPPAVIVRPITQAPVYTQPVVIESYTTYVEHAPAYVHRPHVQHVYVRPAPVYAPPVVYHRPPHPHHRPHYPHGHRPGHGVVSIGFGGHFR